MPKNKPLLTNNSSSNEGLTENQSQATERRDTRFKPGNTFGKGRPVGSKNKGQVALEAIGQEHAEEILQKMIQQALKGDTNAARFLLERCWIQRKGARISFNFPPIHTIQDIDVAISHILEEISQGNISLEEGDMLIKVLKYKSDVMIARDIKRRLDEWEEIFNKKDSPFPYKQ